MKGMTLLFSLVCALLLGIGSAAAQDAPSQNCYIPTDAWVIYEVQAGDTLTSIARRTDTTVALIAEVNCLSNINALRVGQRLWVPRKPDPLDFNDMLRRCRSAGFTTEQCRRIWNANNRSGDIAERCRLAGFSIEECRRLYNAGLDDETPFVERCRSAGFTTEQCRRIWNANNGSGDIVERCRLAGFSIEECRRLYDENPTADPAPTEIAPAENREGPQRERATPTPSKQDEQPNNANTGNR